MSTERIQQDLDYVATVVRRNDRPVGTPVIYYLWAAIVVIGFALPDFAAQFAGPYWFVCGIGGGLISWWIGAREELRTGKVDRELGRRWGYHWLIGGVGFMICWLPVFSGAPAATASGNFLLVGGLVYALAGVHLDRPMLWSGLLMLAAFVVMSILAPPYTWTITGLVIAVSLVWGGLVSRKHRLPAIQQ